MKIHRSWIAVAVLATCCAGCSNLIVKKVLLEKRAEGRDEHIQGFRYYLNRPYLAVNYKILLGERRSLIRVKTSPVLEDLPAEPQAQPVDPPPAGSGPFAPTAESRVTGATATFLDGPRRNETVELDKLMVTDVGGREARSVTKEELIRMRDILLSEREQATSDSTPVAKNALSRSVGKTDDAGITRASLSQDAEFDESDQSPMFGAAPAGGDSAAAPASPAGGVDNTPLPLPTTVGTRVAHSLTGKMQIIYLPDLDEQYVIKSKNGFAKSAFALNFNDDSSLAGVTGNHDATTVGVSLLQQVDKAISAVAGVLGSEASKKSSSTASSTGGSANERKVGEAPGVAYYQLVERFYIKPGLYRLNKPWEMGEGISQDGLVGMGLLAKLGLPCVSEAEIVLPEKSGP